MCNDQKKLLLKPQRGASYLTIAVFTLLASAFIYTAFQITPFFYYYFDLQHQMKSLISVADRNTDKEIREKLSYYLRKYEVDARAEDLRIERGNGYMKLSLQYSEVFYLPVETFRFLEKDYVVHVFEFDVQAEGPF